MASGSETGQKKFGTFGGVFTPNVLTVLGVIMFLRFGQVVGQSGAIYAICIVLAAKLITSLTAVSLAAVATNTRVKGGGAYYLISRSLGIEFGGAIGVVFYLAQAVSVAMYVIGFTEAFTNAFPGIGLSFIEVASLINVIVFISVYIGAGWTIKVQYVILAVLGLSILSFYAGALPAFSVETLAANAEPQFQTRQNVFTMFALFFPAATGIMAGANMSGDLKDPSKSIPSGTFGAIAVTGAIYLTIAVLLAGIRPQSELIANNFIMNDVAVIPALIVAGVFAATLSSALGSMMGAPRILQAFSRDGIVPVMRFFAKGSGANKEPRRAIVLTFIVSQLGITLGDLDVIAPIITMFFMVTYGMLNLACFFESYSRNPSFRPRFRLSHWSTALLGAVGCAVAMFLMAPLWAIVSIVAMATIHWLISRSEVIARWGDVKSGVAFERARRALLQLEEEEYHPKNWRPIILALSGSSWSRYQIAEYGYWLTAGHGVLSLGQVIGGDVQDRMERRRAVERRLRDFIWQEDLSAFPAVVMDSDLLEGVKALLQCHGIGGIRPNTVLIGWSEDPDRTELFANTLRLIRSFERSILIVKCDEDRERWSPPEGEIHVWWQGRRNGPLMLTFAHLLLQNPEFRNRTLRVVLTIPHAAGREEASAHLSTLLETARMNAVGDVVVTDELTTMIATRSADAAVVFLGFDVPDEGDETVFSPSVRHVVGELQNVILVSSAGGVDLEA